MKARDKGGVFPRTHRISLTLTVWLTLVWVLVFASLDRMVIASGILVALLVQWVFPLPHITHTWRIRPVMLLLVVVRFLWDLLVAGVQVSWLVVRGCTPQNGRVQVILRSGDPVHMTIMAGMTSLVPGSVVTGVDVADRVLDLHILDIDAQGGEAGVVASVLAQEKRLLAAIAPQLLNNEKGGRE